MVEEDQQGYPVTTTFSSLNTGVGGIGCVIAAEGIHKVKKVKPYPRAPTLELPTLELPIVELPTSELPILEGYPGPQTMPKYRDKSALFLSHSQAGAANWPARSPRKLSHGSRHRFWNSFSPFVRTASSPKCSHILDPSHRNRAPVLALIYRSIGRDDPFFLSSPANIYIHRTYVGMTPQSLMFLMLQMTSPPPTPPLQTETGKS